MSRSMALFIGGLINLVGFIAPAFSGRLAFALFSRTGSRKPKSEKERAMMEAAAPLFESAEQKAIPLSQGSAVAHVFPMPENARSQKILLVHGWSSSAVHMLGLINGLRAAGAEVVALDLPGHGAAPGKKLHAPLAVEAISKTCEQLGPFDMIAGHSFGGYMTAATVNGVLPGLYVPKPQRVVTIASPSDVRVIFAQYAAMLGLSDTVLKALIGRIEAISGRKAEEFYGPELLAGSGVPALVLHAEDDKEVAAIAARQYAEAGPNIRVEWLNGFGHRRIVNSPEAIEAITKFAA